MGSCFLGAIIFPFTLIYQIIFNSINFIGKIFFLKKAQIGIFKKILDKLTCWKIFTPIHKKVYPYDSDGFFLVYLGSWNLIKSCKRTHNLINFYRKNQEYKIPNLFWNFMLPFAASLTVVCLIVTLFLSSKIKYFQKHLHDPFAIILVRRFLKKPLLLLGFLFSLLILYIHVLAFKICEWCRFVDLDMGVKGRNKKFEDGLEFAKNYKNYENLEDSSEDK